MALILGDLVDALRPLFDPTSMPAESAAVGSWVRAYARYAQSAQAGMVVLGQPLSPAVQPGPFLPALDATITAMWAAAVWIGPGATGATVPVGPISVPLLSNGSSLLANSGKNALQLVSTALHTYTLGITVLVTTAAGATVVPLM